MTRNILVRVEYRGPGVKGVAYVPLDHPDPVGYVTDYLRGKLSAEEMGYAVIRVLPGVLELYP